ncbi:GlsB/YeaQ/YmgE family stress response membrane protein [Chelatococcus reniformis]|uniref:GlsB/YeaQ/YmgE family stress response membrane protein n=1 Tax=Chelatococcus reniformis TaxID=1494448 RepID=A0A916U0K3_9HYPH|nr:GlsB/YeaQ/YmgE family stress response membrane protein [Chelatococcus reniformis]GGC55723.1 hypothetical protein GCM10010994_13300 [Chelatococcus reniformis]
MNDQVYGALGQPGVSFIVAIIVGAIAGWIAERITSSNMGLFTNILMGIIGGIVGRILANLLSISYYGFWANLVAATIGAVIIIYAYRAIRGRTA